MKSNYKRLGPYIRQVDKRNKDDKRDNLLGVSVTKEFIKSIANTVGTDFTKYKVVKKNQFTYIPDTSRRGDKIAVALLENEEDGLVSQAYTVFEISDTNSLLPEYLMMWFKRPEFDRYARFISHGSVREIFSWEDMCDVELPIPSIRKQTEIVNQYKTIQDKINQNNSIIQKVEETTHAIYKQWFVDFEFPNENGDPYRSSGGAMEFNEELDQEIPLEWTVGSIGDYTKVKSGYAFKSDLWEQYGIPVIKIGSIHNNTIDFNQVAYINENKMALAANYKVSKGDIVIAMTGATIGKIGIVPDLNENILVNQRVGMFDLCDNPLEKAPFLYFTLLQPYVLDEIQNNGGDSAQANISSTDIEKIQLLFPESSLINKFNKIGRPVLNIMLSKIKENRLLIETENIMLSNLTKRGDAL